MVVGSNVAIPVPEIRMPVRVAPAMAALALALLLVGGPAQAGEPAAAAPAGDRTWTEVGQPTASFGPPIRVRLGAILTPDLAQPARVVALGQTYDREAFVPNLTGSAAAPGLPVAMPFAPDPAMLSMPRFQLDPRPAVPIVAKGRD